ncbi:IS630 family transposase [Dactylosporangium sp. CA-233914]|uniref:IS630 family transposase n=1 Tax=Dactylosporangium sp. CA-233914 TaxID=3239934 RepID=UPI003D931902
MVSSGEDGAGVGVAGADDLSNSEVSRRLGASLPTAGKWRKRFITQRLAGSQDKTRPGAPRKITDTQVEAVIVMTLEAAPSNQDSHWSTRSMARATGLNQTAVSRIWRASGLKPHLVDTWKLSADPLFIDKVRDVVGLYLDPPDKAMVLAVDETSQMQALDHTAPMPPMMPGTPERRGRQRPELGGQRRAHHLYRHLLHRHPRRQLVRSPQRRRPSR